MTSATQVFFRRAVLVLILGAIPLAVLGLNLYALHQWMEIRDLEKNGIATEAVLVAKDSNDPSRNSTYRITLRYDATLQDTRAATLKTEQVVDESLFKRTMVGGQVKLHYSAVRPEQVHVSGNDIYLKHILYAFVGDQLLVIAAVGLFRMERHSRIPATS